MSSKEFLATAGIESGEDVKHSMNLGQSYIDPDEYFAQATTFLDDLSPGVFEHVAPELDDYADRWNPGGFMVFPLGLHEELGSLRLHVWPPGAPRKSADGPSIHSHAWHLCSEVLSGTYSDTLFNVESAAEEGQENVFTLYKTKRKDNGEDALVADGNVKATPIGEREFSSGEIHTIEAGVYHIPTVSQEGHAATLVLDSPALAETTGVLIQNGGGDISRVRRSLEISDIALAKQVLLEP